MAPLFRLVVMGGMDSGLWPSPFGRAARVCRPAKLASDEPPSVIIIRLPPELPHHMSQVTRIN
jgi:hypothetical protein